MISSESRNLSGAGAGSCAITRKTGAWSPIGRACSGPAMARGELALPPHWLRLDMSLARPADLSIEVADASMALGDVAGLVGEVGILTCRAPDFPKRP